MRTLTLIAGLLAALDEAEIRYCHWKSSGGLAAALAGETDLDLLVDRGHSGKFTDEIRRLGFKPFVSHKSRQLPGVTDWLGLDVASRHLVHLHVYEELVLGEELVKNHRLPIEDVLLEHTERRFGMPVLIPELELAVLAVRGLLKYRDDAFVRDMIPIGHRAGLPKGISEEINGLLARTSSGAVGAAAARLLPMLPPRVIVEFLDAAGRRPIDAREMRRLRLDLENALRSYTRHGMLTVLTARTAAAINRSRFLRAWRRIQERLRERPPGRRKTPAGGGRTVAVIGIDGSGKSTVVQALVETFGWRVNVVSLYLGSSRPGLRTSVVQGMARATRRADASLARRGENPALWLRRFVVELAAGLRAIAEARERRRRVELGSRLASRGWLVVYDRYPMPALTVGSRRMDAHRLPTPSLASGWWSRRLAQREAAIYRRIGSPDLVIALRLDTATARARKPEAPAALDAKAAALDALGVGDAGVVVIDAGLPQEDVLRRAASAVWKCL
ncbi:MAG: hypothetical protein ACR2I5_00395 [Candidatus Limnocylindria bacterium]